MFMRYICVLCFVPIMEIKMLLLHYLWGPSLEACITRVMIVFNIEDYLFGDSLSVINMLYI